MGVPQVKYDDADAKERTTKGLGDISEIEVFNNQVVVAVYVRPEKTKGGIILSTGARKEDEIQSKVGLVLAMGSSAFTSDGQSWFSGLKRPVQVGDWLMFRASDGFRADINGVTCRWLDDTRVRARIPHPDMVF